MRHSLRGVTGRCSADCNTRCPGKREVTYAVKPCGLARLLGNSDVFPFCPDDVSASAKKKSRLCCAIARPCPGPVVVIVTIPIDCSDERMQLRRSETLRVIRRLAVASNRFTFSEVVRYAARRVSANLDNTTCLQRIPVNSRVNLSRR